MKKIRFYVLFLLGCILLPASFYAQDNDVNFDLLFDKWDIVQNGSTEEDLVVKKSNRKSSYTYDFTIGTDSVMYQNKIAEQRPLYLDGIRTPAFTTGAEVWSYEPRKARLRYDIYFDSIAGKKPADYSLIYKIVSLDKEYLKLRLKKELFEGVE